MGQAIDHGREIARLHDKLRLQFAQVGDIAR